jgi:DNA-binding transcriptional LysR family regulator
MELKQLEYFVSVADAGSFTAAAVILNLAQPTLSRQIANKILNNAFATHPGFNV